MGELQIKKQSKKYDVVIVGSGAGGGMAADVGHACDIAGGIEQQAHGAGTVQGMGAALSFSFHQRMT